MTYSITVTGQLKEFHFLILEGGLLGILIDCMMPCSGCSALHGVDPNQKKCMEKTPWGGGGGGRSRVSGPKGC